MNATHYFERHAPNNLARSASSRGLRHWLQPYSIRVRLFGAFALLLLLVVGLGWFGIQRLAEINRVSEVIRSHWLQNTRILADLSNDMSDYRAAEATRLLSMTAPEISASDAQLASLSAAVARSQRAYDTGPQEPWESELYALFAEQWTGYQSIVAQVVSRMRAGETSEGVALYLTDSRRAFDLSSGTLARLTDQTVARATDAGARSAATYRRARTLFLSALLLAATALIGVVLYITRSILDPLLALARPMRALAEHDADVFIPSAERNDEVGQMARSVAVFRDNAVALMNSQRRLLEQAAKLEEALENERRLTAQQRNFVSMTSHEFRTPLTIIDGHAQRLIKMRDRLDPADVVERSTGVRAAVLRMTNIMDSLLAASRLLDGQAVYHPCDFNPATLLRDACQAHREATRGANISDDIDGLPMTLHGDPKLLFHVFSNLISNAIKFSPEGSPIEVIARQEMSQVVVQVRDHGIGIPARDRRRLFERYFRGGNATGIAGTGVGLHLVAMVVTLHQGEVVAESLEGVGSTFIVRLPVSASFPAEEQSVRRLMVLSAAAEFQTDALAPG